MKKVIIIGSIVLLIGTAAFFYYRNQANILQDKSSLKIVDIVPVTLGIDETVLNVKVQISNVSNLQAQVTSLNLDVLFNNIKVGTIASDPFIIPANGFSNAEAVVNFSPEEILGNVGDILTISARLKDVAIKIDGVAWIILGGFIPWKIDFIYNTTLKEFLS